MNASRFGGDNADSRRIVPIHVAAPAKPAEREPCNGCGVCCAYAPCPLGVLVSRRTQGACAALVWVEAGNHYRCGLIARPEVHLWRPLRRWAPALARLARRYVAAGSGCDSSLVIAALGAEAQR